MCDGMHAICQKNRKDAGVGLGGSSMSFIMVLPGCCNGILFLHALLLVPVCDLACYTQKYVTKPIIVATAGYLQEPAAKLTSLPNMYPSDTTTPMPYNNIPIPKCS